MRLNLIAQLSGSAKRVFNATTRLNELAGTRNKVALADAKKEARRAVKADKKAEVNLERHRLMHGC